VVWEGIKTPVGFFQPGHYAHALSDFPLLRTFPKSYVHYARFFLYSSKARNHEEALAAINEALDGMQKGRPGKPARALLEQGVPEAVLRRSLENARHTIRKLAEEQAAHEEAAARSR